MISVQMKTDDGDDFLEKVYPVVVDPVVGLAVAQWNTLEDGYVPKQMYIEYEANGIKGSQLVDINHDTMVMTCGNVLELHIQHEWFKS